MAEKMGEKQKYLLLVIGVAILGIVFTFMPFGGNGKKTSVVQTVKENTGTTSKSYERDLECRLTEILKQMAGVGEVEVMITVYSNEEKILAEDVTQSSQNTTEQDQAGGTRTSQSTNTNNEVVMQNGNMPYVVKENKPDIKGVLILAEGAGDSNVKSELVDAVSKLLEVPVHKVSVMQKQK